MPCSIGAASDSSVSQGDEEGASFLSTEVDLSKRTKRQREVFPLLVQGLSNKEIARALEIAEATTKSRLAALLRTLGVRNRTEAADKADYVVNLTGSTDAEGRGDCLTPQARHLEWAWISHDQRAGASRHLAGRNVTDRPPNIISRRSRRPAVNHINTGL